MPESVYRKCKGNVLEMSCVLAIGNVPEISCVLVQEMFLKCPICTAPGKVKEMSKFPGVGNVHARTRNVNFPAHFMGFPCPGNLGFLPVTILY